MLNVTTIDRGNLQQWRRDNGFQESLPAALSTMSQTPLPPPPPDPSNAITRIICIDAVPKTSKKLRVAAYCRVSTHMEAQETSIQSQTAHYRSFILTNPEWELEDIYIDSGVSGTEAAGRAELIRMLDHAQEGKIDLILAKSISRFARNTAECLAMVRMLTAYHVDISFEKEHLDTKTDGFEFMLSLLACFAEQESRSISGNLKWGIRKRFEHGTYKTSIAPYGYRKEGATIVVEPAEAVVVRRMYHDLANGKGAAVIAKELNTAGNLTRRGNYWSYPRIRDLVKNTVYVGDMLYQKTYMNENYIQCLNDGVLDRYYLENHHEAIVDRTAAVPIKCFLAICFAQNAVAP